MAATLSDQIDAVAKHATTLDLEGEDWQRAVAVNGLLASGRQLDDARRLVDRAIDTQTSEGMFAYGWGNYPKEWADWTEYDVASYKPTQNPAAMATSALEFYERTGDDRYLDAVRRQYEFLKSVDRTADGGISRRANTVELFTEGLYFVAPWLVQYGTLTDDRDAIDDAATQIEVHLKHLQDPHTGLFRHIWSETPNTYPEGSFWARGNGWATAGLLDSILELPADHPTRETATDALSTAVAAIVERQDASGFWHMCLDDPQSTLETSGTLTFAYTLRKGIDEGLLDESYAEPAERAMAACRGVVSDAGAVTRVSKPPASATSPLGVTPYGQGWFLLAAEQFV